MSNAKYDALDRVTKWIKESSSEEFMKNFNKLEGEFEGMTIAEYLDECGVLSGDDSEFRSIMTTPDFIFGLEDEPVSNASDSISDKYETYTASPQESETFLSNTAVLLDNKNTDYFTAKNDSPYCLDTIGLAA